MTEAAMREAVERFLNEVAALGYEVALVITVKKVHIQNTNPMKFHSSEVEVFSLAKINDAYLRDSVVRATLRVAREKLVAKVSALDYGSDEKGEKGA